MMFRGPGRLFRPCTACLATCRSAHTARVRPAAQAAIVRACTHYLPFWSGPRLRTNRGPSVYWIGANSRQIRDITRSFNDSVLSHSGVSSALRLMS